MYIQTSINDRNELSKILTRELSKNFINGVESLEKFYVSSMGDLPKIAKRYNLKIVDIGDRLLGANQVLFFRSDGRLEVEGLRQFGSEQYVLKFLALFKNYFGAMDVIRGRYYRTYNTTSQKNLNKFADHLYKNFNVSADIVGSDLIGAFGNIIFVITRSPFSETISLKFKTDFFNSK